MISSFFKRDYLTKEHLEGLRFTLKDLLDEFKIYAKQRDESKLTEEDKEKLLYIYCKLKIWSTFIKNESHRLEQMNLDKLFECIESIASLSKQEIDE